MILYRAKTNETTYHGQRVLHLRPVRTVIVVCTARTGLARGNRLPIVQTRRLTDCCEKGVGAKPPPPEAEPCMTPLLRWPMRGSSRGSHRDLCSWRELAQKRNQYHPSLQVAC